jgi:predicted transposase/invertase (TIGR01784 family)
MLYKFLDPKNDFCFKKIFGSEKNKDILIHFLNDMLVFKENLPIQNVTFLKTIQEPEIAVQKTSIVDVLCKDERGNQYIVEIQVAKEKGFEKRAQYYAAKAYCSQAHAGGSYADLKEIIFLAIADFVVFPNKAAYKSDHIVLDKETCENDLKDFSFTFLELPKFNKTINNLETIIEKWAYFFKHAETTSEHDVQKIIEGDDIMERVYEELNRFSWNEEELLTYDQSEKYYNSYLATIEYGIEKGREEGREEGKKEGREEGKKEGREEGIEIGFEKSKLAIAQNMLKAGIDEKTISLVTGLSLEQIKAFFKI